MPLIFFVPICIQELFSQKNENEKQTGYLRIREEKQLLVYRVLFKKIWQRSGRVHKPFFPPQQDANQPIIYFRNYALEEREEGLLTFAGRRSQVGTKILPFTKDEK